jgi:hypothetical protein
VVRRSVYLQLLDSGFEFLASDRRGSSLNSGGDSEISREFARLGSRLYFDAGLRLRHWIPKERLTRDYALRLWRGFGAGTIASDAERIAAFPNHRFRNAVRRSWTYQVLRGLWGLIRIIHKHPCLHPTDPRESLPYCSLQGRLSEIQSLGMNYGRLINSRVKYINRAKRSAM